MEHGRAGDAGAFLGPRPALLIARVSLNERRERQSLKAASSAGFDDVERRCRLTPAPLLLLLLHEHVGSERPCSEGAPSSRRSLCIAAHGGEDARRQSRLRIPRGRERNPPEAPHAV